MQLAFHLGRRGRRNNAARHGYSGRRPDVEMDGKALDRAALNLVLHERERTVSFSVNLPAGSLCK